jgi:heat-inducible transcriptional repressor
MDFNIDERKIKILQAIIHDYIITGEPVGSRTIAKKYDLGISSATIRNEMSDLEELGLIEQLHTSSGRKPSDKGYRLYVDKLIKVPKLTKEEELMIKAQLINQALYEVDKIVKKAVLLLSELTKLTCVVKTPSVRNSSIKMIQLLGIDNNSILSIIVTQNGMINNNLIRINKVISNDALQKISNFLNSKLTNLTIQDINLKVINELKSGLKGYEDIFDAIITVLYDALNKADNSEVYYEGAANIFNYPEYNDVEKARQFLSLVDNKSLLAKLFNSGMELNPDNSNIINISIGKENIVEDAKECSVISTAYILGNEPLGTIGVIGPTRMQYSKVISLLTQLVEILNKNIGQIYFDDK